MTESSERLRGRTLVGSPTPIDPRFSAQTGLAKTRDVERPYLLASIGSAAVYTVIWSIISIWRVFALVASVYDLGTTLQPSYVLFTYDTNPLHLVATFFVVGGAYFFLPFAYLPLSSVLIFQSVALASVGPAVYLIARRLALSPAVSLAMSFAALLYFPLAGMNYFDVNYLVLVLPLVLWAYYLALRRQFLASALFWFVLGVLYYPIAAIPTFFGAVLLLPWILDLRPSQLFARGRAKPRDQATRTRVAPTGFTSKLRAVMSQKLTAKVLSREWVVYLQATGIVVL